MKTVSMGTSAREGASERRQSLAHVLQLLLQEEDLSLAPTRDGMEPVLEKSFKYLTIIAT